MKECETTINMSEQISVDSPRLMVEGEIVQFSTTPEAGFVPLVIIDPDNNKGFVLYVRRSIDRKERA